MHLEWSQGKASFQLVTQEGTIYEGCYNIDSVKGDLTELYYSTCYNIDYENVSIPV